MRNGGRGERKRSSPERDPNFFTQRHGRETLRGFPESPQRDLPPEPWPEGRGTAPQRNCREPPKSLPPRHAPSLGEGKRANREGMHWEDQVGRQPEVSRKEKLSTPLLPL